jgi:enamine deaminase RidA (YjgF/YER057c/UK114 family)
MPVVQGINPVGANIIPFVRTGNLLFISGMIGPGANGERVAGKLGAECSVEQGYECARQAALRMLTRVREATGNLDKVRRVVKVLAFIASAPDFTEQPRVANGFSDLLIEVFGENGRHARSAVGVAALPGNAPVEVEAIFEVE